MPNEGQFADYKPLRRIAESERVKKLLGSFRVRDRGEGTDPFYALATSQMQSSDWKPTWVMAVDGSYAPVDVQNGFPGAEAAYITMASVLLDVEKMRMLDQQRPVNPSEFRTVQRAQSVDCALPGCNIVYEDEDSAKASFRRAVFEIFVSERVFSDSETLLDTYEALQKHRPISSREMKCPCDNCPNAEGKYKRGTGRYVCNCDLRQHLYSTDALGSHEKMNPVGKNGATFMEIMQVLERLWIVHFLRALEARKWLSSLGRLAIVLDGPLAVFGDPAWLSQAIYKELCRINKLVNQATGGQDILFLGVEKTGVFAEHLNSLDQHESGSKGKYPPQSVALLTNQYIRQNIQFSWNKQTENEMYGDATYFGRKFFYKTRTGALLVGSLPFLSEDHKDLKRADVTQFPRLGDALGLLDDLFCSRYPNAVAPIVAAHAEAAIPLNLGKKVLEQLAKDLMAEGKA